MTQHNYRRGARVQLHAATDAWMMGDRYGVVTGYKGALTRVKLDKSGRSVLLREDDIAEEVERGPLLPHVCPKCERHFSTRSGLWSHMRRTPGHIASAFPRGAAR